MSKTQLLCPTQLMRIKETAVTESFGAKNLNSVKVWLPPSATARLSPLIIWIPLPAEVCGTSFNDSSFLLSHSWLKKKQKEETKSADRAFFFAACPIWIELGNFHLATGDKTELVLNQFRRGVTRLAESAWPGFFSLSLSLFFFFFQS